MTRGSFLLTGVAVGLMPLLAAAASHDTAASLTDLSTLCRRISTTPRRVVRKPLRDQRERDFRMLAQVADALLESTPAGLEGSSIPSREALTELRAAARARDAARVRAACGPLRFDTPRR